MSQIAQQQNYNDRIPRCVCGCACMYACVCVCMHVCMCVHVVVCLQREALRFLPSYYPIPLFFFPSSLYDLFFYPPSLPPSLSHTRNLPPCSCRATWTAVWCAPRPPLNSPRPASALSSTPTPPHTEVRQLSMGSVFS